MKPASRLTYLISLLTILISLVAIYYSHRANQRLMQIERRQVQWKNPPTGLEQ